MEEEKKVEVELEEELYFGYIKTRVSVKPVEIGYRVARKLGLVYKVSYDELGDKICINFSEYRDVRIDDIKKMIEDAIEDCRNLREETLVFYL